MQILESAGLAQDCVQGRTKIFIRSPQTVFRLEELRTEQLPNVITFLQKVRSILKLTRLRTTKNVFLDF